MKKKYLFILLCITSTTAQAFTPGTKEITPISKEGTITESMTSWRNTNYKTTKISGSNTEDFTGRSVSSAGDVNGDGYDDVLVGSYGYTDGSSKSAGKASLYLGSSSGVTTTPSWEVMGEGPSYTLGYSTTGKADFNNDGYADIAVGSHCYGDGTENWIGKAYAYYGGTSGPSTTADWSDEGPAKDSNFGSSLAYGDVNGDGYDDLLVGATQYDNFKGKIFLYLGSSSGLDTSPAWEATGDTYWDFFSISINTGDFNNDGYDDIIVGAPGYDSTSKTDNGKAYIYNGSASGPSETADFTITGTNDDDSLGISVSSGGDVNGDGYDDILIGAHRTDSGSTANTGTAYAFYGSSSGPSSSADWSANGEYANDWFGYSVSKAGDINGDGYSDVIIGTNSESRTGKASVFYGSSSGLSLTADQSLKGKTVDDAYGASVSSAGDMNGDGYDEVIVGAYEYDTSSHTDAGKVYIYDFNSEEKLVGIFK